MVMSAVDGDDRTDCFYGGSAANFNTAPARSATFLTLIEVTLVFQLNSVILSQRKCWFRHVICESRKIISVNLVAIHDFPRATKQ